MKMNRTILSKTNTLITKPILNLLIFLIFISTCSKNPTESTANNNTAQGFSIYHEISIGEQTLNNIIVKADTITAFVTYEGLPAIEQYVAFNILNNAQGQLTPATATTNSMGEAKSIYKLVYIDELLSDTIINVQIDIGAGNNANSISAHDTVNIVYELKAVDPLSAIEYFNFSPNNANLVNLASEDLEVSVIARNDAGVGVCNIPVRFQLIGDEGSIPNGSINSEVGYTCESSTSDDDTEGSNTFGKASVKYTNDGGGIDYLIAKILDPANDTLYLFADTIRIETVGSTQLINDVVSISANMSQSIINIDNPDSTKTDTIFARALDENGAIISGIPFQFTLSNNYLGAVYLSDGGSISDDLGIANSVVNIYPSLFSELNGTISSSSLNLIVNITIPSTDLNSSLGISVLNNLPIWEFDSDSLIYTTINRFNFEPNNDNIVSLPDVLEKISIIVKDESEVGLCGIPVQFRLEPEEEGAEVLGVISSSIAITCDTTESITNIPGIASVNYYNVTNGVDILIAEIKDPQYNTVTLLSDTLQIETVGSTNFINNVASMAAGLGSLSLIDGSSQEFSEISIEHPFNIKQDTLFAIAVDINGSLISEIPFQFIIEANTDIPDLGNHYYGTVYLSSQAAISDADGFAHSYLHVHPSIFSIENVTLGVESILLTFTIIIPSTNFSETISIKVINELPIGSGNSSALFYSKINTLNYFPDNDELLSLPGEEEEISIIVKDSLGAGICDIPVTFRLEEVSPNPNIIGVISASSATTCDTSNGSNISGVAQIKYNNSIEGSDLLIVEIADPEDELIILFSDSLLINTVGSTSLIEIVTEISANATQSYLSVFNPDSIITDTVFARALDVNGAVVPEIPFQFTISNITVGVFPLELSEINGTIFLSAGASISDSVGIAYSIINIHPSLFPYLESLSEFNTIESVQLNVTITIPSTELSRTIDIEIINDLPFWYPSSAELTLISSSYILPCESCEDSTPAIITATVLDSLNNPPPSGTIIEFSSLQKDTTGISEEGFEWVPIGNIAPATTLDPNGIATTNFYMQNDRGVAYIIGSVDPFNVSDTIQIIIESLDANHIEILPPALDEIVVQGGGGIEYSEVFVQITDDAGNIIYDKPYKVRFKLAGAPSGATLENGVNEIEKTTDSGETSVTIVSGTAPGAVHLLVELFNVDDVVGDDPPIATAAFTPLIIVTGAPEYGEINFSVIDMAPVVGAGIYEYPLSVYLEDVHSNPVADSTSVYFKIRENADPWDVFSEYNYNDKVTWFDGEATVLDSVVYTCIDNLNNCLAGTTPDTDGSWLPSAHPAEIVGHGETGMESPFDGNSYPGVAFSKILFGSNSIAAEVIVFVQTYSASSTEFIIDSRTNHSGNGIVFPCYECSISLIALPTQWDFSQPPFNVDLDTDFQDVTVNATVTDYFQFPVFNAEIVLDAPQADFVYVCGGEDTDLDGTTGDCTLVADETTTLLFVQDCWTCVENYAPDYAWIIEDSDGNDGPDTDGTLMLTPDDIPNYARTSSTGVGAWIIRYSEGVNIPQGTDPVTYQTFNTTITVSLITPSTNNPSETVTIIISKSEED